MQSLRSFITNRFHIILFAALSVLILWQMLLPGYVLTLDMVFTPFVYFRPDYGDLYYAFPLYGVLWLLHWIIPVWILQKMLLFLILFCTGYNAYRFLPLGESRLVRIFAGLVYLFNPFVYTRFLAGHWTVLAGYALLPLLTHLLLSFLVQPGFRKSVRYFVVLWLMAVLSVQIFAMSIFLSLATVIIVSIKHLFHKHKKWFLPFFKHGFLGTFLFLAASSYWLIGFFLRSTPVEGRFTLAHWEIFSASTRSSIPLWLNLLSLNGFWAESQAWARNFMWTQDFTVFWIAWIILFLLVITGLVYAFAKRIKYAAFFLIIGMAGYILAPGVSDTLFKGINVWFFEHVPFWSGFRDSQKFTALLALGYTFFAAYGVSALMAFFKKIRFPTPISKVVQSFILLVPIGMGFLLFFGLHGQIKPVWYPDSWFVVKQTLEQDTSSAKMLVLPWHRYMPFQFADNALLDNPTNRFFGPLAIVPKNLEVGEVYDQEIDPVYRMIDAFIRDKSIDSDTSLRVLTRQGVRYIFFLKDLNGRDSFRYPFLENSGSVILFENDDLAFYRIGQ